VPVQVEHAAGDAVLESPAGTQVVHGQYIIAHDTGPFANADLRRAAVVPPGFVFHVLIVVQHLHHPPPRLDFRRRQGFCIRGIELGDLDLQRIAARAVGPDAGHRQVLAVQDRLQPAVGQRRARSLRLDVAHEAVDRHGQLQPVFGAAFGDGEPRAARHVGLARTVDELPGLDRFGAGFAANDAGRDPPVAGRAGIDELGVQQQLHAAPQQQFLQHQGQDVLLEHPRTLLGVRRAVWGDGLESFQVRDDRVEHFALALRVATEVRHAAHGQVAAGDGETLDEHHPRPGLGGGAGCRDAGNAAADDRHVGLVANWDLPRPADRG